MQTAVQRLLEMCACISGQAMITHCHNSEVTSMYYESTKELTDKSIPLKSMSRDPEQDENLCQRNLACFAKGICHPETTALTFPVLELNNTYYRFWIMHPES